MLLSSIETGQGYHPILKKYIQLLISKNFVHQLAVFQLRTSYEDVLTGISVSPRIVLVLLPSSDSSVYQKKMF